MTQSLSGRHFLKLLDFSSEEIVSLVDLAQDLKEKKHAGVLHKELEGKNIVLLFEKTSTRTPCNGILDPLCNTDRMIADTFKVFSNHQYIERIGFIGFMLDDMTSNASFYLFKQGINFLVPLDARLALSKSRST